MAGRMNSCDHWAVSRRKAADILVDDRPQRGCKPETAASSTGLKSPALHADALCLLSLGPGGKKNAAEPPAEHDNKGKGRAPQAGK